VQYTRDPSIQDHPPLVIFNVCEVWILMKLCMSISVLYVVGISRSNYLYYLTLFSNSFYVVLWYYVFA
jgi:hypothetical protein